MNSGAIDRSVLGAATAVKPLLLCGSRVSIRPATVDDAADWLRLRATAGPAQRPFAGIAQAQGLLAEMAALGDHQPGWRQYLVLDTHGRAIGDIGLCWPMAGMPAELGFELAPEARGQGLAQQAVGLLVEWAQLNVASEIAAITQLENHPAQALLQRLGFRRQEAGPAFEVFAVTASECLFLKQGGSHA